MKTKVKIIIIAIAIISTIILIGLTNSRYFTQVELVGDFEVATAIIDIENQTKTEEIEKLLPGDTFEYCFSVNNYDTEGNLNELLMQYSIEIETSDDNVLPLEYTIYELKEDRTTVEITKSNNTFELPYCNSESDKSTRNFKIVFTWDEDKNEAETYADKTYTFTVKAVATYSNYIKTAESEEITLTSKPYKELEVSIEETDETNVYNVTITNNNDYDVKYLISIKEDDKYYIEYEDTMLTAREKEIIEVKVFEIEEDDPMYYILDYDENLPENEKVDVNIIVQSTAPYSGEKLELPTQVTKQVVVINAQIIQENGEKYYGAKVNYEVVYDDTEDKNNYWRIYHSDGENIYLIVDEYISYDYAPLKNGNALTQGETYRCMYFNSNIQKQYNGASDIPENVGSRWLSEFISLYPTSTGNTIKYTAYLLDTEIWNEHFKNKYAEYAIGAPTIEMFVASYNVTHADDPLDYNATESSNGYKLKRTNVSSYSSSINIEVDYNGIYARYVDDMTLKGYWIASPSSNSSYIWSKGCQNDGAGTLNYGYNPTSVKVEGLRVIVCLNSDITLYK